MTNIIKKWWLDRSAMEKWMVPLFSLLLLNSCVMLSVVLRNKQNETVDIHYRTTNNDANRDLEIRKRLLLQLAPGINNPNGAAQRIKGNMKILTKSVHIAGTQQNMEALNFIADTYRNIGLDFVETPEYNVLLSYPDAHNPSHVSVDGLSLGPAVSTLLGPAEAQKQENASAIAKIWWNAYAKGGVASGNLVYANYGQERDFATLKEHNVTVVGKIVIIRYGHGWRGAKVYQAELNKAAGVILYTDPEDYVHSDNPVYPSGPSMPSEGTQRGTLWQGDGDPLTPFYPAKNYTFRSVTEAELREQNMLPSIPVLPVSYGYAKNILKSMDGPTAPTRFRGKLNITYKLTGSKNYAIQVETPEYNVLLSYPDAHNPSHVSVDGLSLGPAVSTLLGPAEAQKQENASAIAKIWWNAYAKGGVASGNLVYANYGQERDFATLKEHNVTVVGKIVIIRYGHGWRGAKVYQAELNKAAGVILYTDPEDYVHSDNPVYPSGPSMPSEGTQRGTLWQGDGDPLTPFYPAKNYTFRSVTEAELREQNMLPSIPVLPVSYGYAKNILKSMDGPTAPTRFRGKLNITYKLTGSKNYAIQVNQNTTQAKIRNVIGYLVGQEEPDRWIILGNHVDAWTYGSQDPNSGTVSLLEVARGMMAVVNATGWRPRRSILFCSWDSEEYGLIGSNEWVEEYFKSLQSKAVAVLNVDNLKGALSLDISATPTMYRTLMQAAGVVPNPIQSEVALGRATVLDTWKYYHNDSAYIISVMPNSTMPRISPPGGGSDHKRFLMYVGIPIVYITYKGPGNRGYPLYHTMYETEWTYENLVDANFSVVCAVSQFWAESARLLADSLPMISSANSGAPTSLRTVEMLNARLSMLERVFINPRGLPGRPGTRHIIYADSVANSYSGETFAGVYDSLAKWHTAVKMGQPQAVIRQYFRDIMTSINDIQYSIESAIQLLQTEQFM